MYRRRLEAFFRAGSVTDPCVAALELSVRYATLSELLSAHPVVVAEYAGEQIADLLANVWSLMLHAREDDIFERRPIRCEHDLAEFLKTAIGSRCDETLIVLFLDSGRSLIDYEVVAVGSAVSVEFDQRRILLRAIGRGAAGIIVAHNHPSGDPRPSVSDIEITRRLADVARSFGITLHDHLVVAGGEVRSALFLN